MYCSSFFIRSNHDLIGGLEHEFCFSIQLGMESSSQLTLTPSFFRGVAKNNQPDYNDIMRIYSLWLFINQNMIHQPQLMMFWYIFDLHLHSLLIQNHQPSRWVCVTYGTPNLMLRKDQFPRQQAHFHFDPQFSNELMMIQKQKQKSRPFRFFWIFYFMLRWKFPC